MTPSTTCTPPGKPTPRTPEDNVADAYKAMANEADYHPGDDGCEASLDQEARAYATQWLAEEDTDTFGIGCTDFTTAKATVYAIEAARLLCAGVVGVATARRLLTMALAELEPAEAEHWPWQVA
jgi:hypothetical protein